MFKQLKVIELASVLAGPSVGMFFAELGAQVLKIENKRQKGDVTRSWKLPSENSENKSSAYFSSVNYGKQHLLLDFHEQKDFELLISHIQDADIIISNFKLGDDMKYRLDYASLKKINPKLIYTALKGFREIPGRTGYDVVVQAETGYMSMNGTEDSGPLKMPLAFMDLLAAHQLKEGILLGLLNREKTGKGSYIECTLEESGIASLANQASNWLMAGHIPQPIGSLHPNIAPYGDTFKCADGKALVLAIGSDAQFQKLTLTLGHETLGTKDEFISNQKRVENRKALQEALQKEISGFKRDELLEQLIAANVPAGAIRNIKEVFETKTARDMILNSEIEGEKTSRVKSIAFRADFLED